MNSTIKSHIDLCLLDEYAYKSFNSGYSLHVSDLPDNEIANFLDTLFKHDPVLKEMITDRMQELIEERLPIYECQHRYSRGYVPVQDRANGEVHWIANRRGI